MAEKRLIATRADENHKEISEITHKYLKEYADRCKADFLVISDKYKDFHLHYRILKFYELFNDYDILILKRCPIIFDIIPKGMIGSIYEDQGSRKEDRRMRLKAVQKKFGSVNFEKGYINTGVALFNKEQKEIFNLTIKDVWDGLGFDDVTLWYQIHKLNYTIFELAYTYNFMSMFSESWNNNTSRFHANIIHYAGNGFYPLKSRMDNIKEDYIILKKYGML